MQRLESRVICLPEHETFHVKVCEYSPVRPDLAVGLDGFLRDREILVYPLFQVFLGPRGRTNLGPFLDVEHALKQSRFLVVAAREQRQARKT